MSDSTTIDLGGEGQSFPFDEIGDRVVGKIISFEQMQQTDMETNEPKFWPSGQPMTMVRIDLKTKIRDDATDDGMRSVYLRGSKKASSQSSMAAVLSAIKETTGSTTLQIGAVMSLELIGEEKPKRRGHNGRKLYESYYKAPAVNLDAEEEKPSRRKPKPVDDEELDDEPVRKPRRRPASVDDGLDDDEEEKPAKRRRAPIDDEGDEPVRTPRRRPAPIEDDDDVDDEPVRPAKRRRRAAPIDEDEDFEDQLKV